MQQTHQLQHIGAVQARPASLAQAGAGARLAYIDVVRLVLIILVIMVHAAVTYGSLGEWTYEDPVQDELSGVLLSLFVISCQAFFMGLFFFFSGYFTPGSYDRKGPALFWKDRLLRLALPMVVYTWVLSKVPNYIAAVYNGGMQISFGQYFTRYFWSAADEGPTWFLFALLAFSAVYTVIRLSSSSARAADRLSRLPVPTTRALLAAALAMAVMTFAVAQVLPLGEMADIFGLFSFQFQFFPTYILLFAAGMLAYRAGWMSRFPASALRLWAWLSAVLLAALPALLILGGAADDKLPLFMSGFTWRCAAFSLWLGLACVAFSMALTLWLRGRVAPASRLAAFTGPHTFAVYLIHPLVLVPITWGLSYLSLHNLLKFSLASALTVAACFALAAALRRVPGVKEVL